MPISINPLNQKTYQIPHNLDDSDSIKKFLSKNKDKKVIAVQGLGFVGAVMALVCANSEKEDYAVIGVDLATENSFWKIESINAGLFPLVADDPKIKEFFENSIRKGNFLATYDPIAYQYADVVIVDINLDVQKESNDDATLKEFDVDLGAFKSAIKSIGVHCKETALILVETTVPPGTCERIVKPIVENELTKRGLSLDLYRLGHSYERVMPGPNYINSIIEFPRVYSGCSQESAEAIEGFLATIIDTSKCELTRLKDTNATEMAKVLENAYRAMNISFVVEWSRFAEEAGVDLYSLVDAIRVRSTHSNLMYPGIGVGGYCLTKDPLLASWSRKDIFGSEADLSMSINSVSVNDQMPIFAFNRLIEVFGDLKDKQVMFLGVSYRGDVGDTRFTPVKTLFDKVIEVGASVSLHDPFVAFWEENKCNIETNCDELLMARQDLLIISTGHSQYRSEEFIRKLLEIEPTYIYDTVGLLTDEQISRLKIKHTISVLGRGDL